MQKTLNYLLNKYLPQIDFDSYEEFREKFEKRGMANFRIRGERIDVDATDPAKIDIEALITQIRVLLRK